MQQDHNGQDCKNSERLYKYRNRKRNNKYYLILEDLRRRVFLRQYCNELSPDTKIACRHAYQAILKIINSEILGRDKNPQISTASLISYMPFRQTLDNHIIESINGDITDVRLVEIKMQIPLFYSCKELLFLNPSDFKIRATTHLAEHIFPGEAKIITAHFHWFFDTLAGTITPGWKAIIKRTKPPSLPYSDYIRRMEYKKGDELVNHEVSFIYTSSSYTPTNVLDVASFIVDPCYSINDLQFPLSYNQLARDGEAIPPDAIAAIVAWLHLQNPQRLSFCFLSDGSHGLNFKSIY